MQRITQVLSIAALGVAIITGWQLWSSGQQPPTGQAKAAADLQPLGVRCGREF